MFHFFSNSEKEALACLDAGQQQRVQHVRSSHRCIKDLNTAVHEAIRCHERYLDALEKVINFMAVNSDTWEDARSGQLGDCADSIVPTRAAADHLATAYNTWKVSEELVALHKELQDLQKLTDSTRQITKRNKTNVENFEKCALRCNAVNSPEHQSKISQRSGKAKEKLVEEQRELNQRMATLDATVRQDIHSTGSWWSEKIVLHCDTMYNVFAQLGQRTVNTFPQSAPRVASPAAAAAAGAAASAGELSKQHAFSLAQQSPTGKLLNGACTSPTSTPPAAAASSAPAHTSHNPAVTPSSAPPALYNQHFGIAPAAAPTAPPQYANTSTTSVHLASASVSNSGGGGVAAQAYGTANTAAGVPLEFQTSRVNGHQGKTVD